MKKIFIIIVSLTIVLYTKAQSIPKLQDPTNQFIIDRAIDIDTSGGVIYYKVDSLKPTQLFTTYFSSTGLGALDVMVKVNTTKDSILADEDSPEPNLYHDVYKQYYNGILVEGSDYTIHHDGENVWSSSGFIVEGLNLSVIPEINESTALNYATSHIGCESYDWDSTGNNPVGTLVLLPVGDEEVYNASNYKLVWKFTLVGFNPSYNKTIYINANTGAALAEHNNVHDGSFNHIYYGTKYDLDTRKKTGNWFTSDKWYLHANDDTRNILTTDEDGIIPYNNRYKKEFYYEQKWNWDDMQYSNGDDVWANDNWSATAAHYCTQKTWDYYKQTALNRNGMTGWGKHVRVIADYPFANAAYSKVSNEDHMLIGRINNNYLATYDIIGHEFTHGVVENSRPLTYEKISGAINESFADIFGFMVERYVFGYVRNWTIGEDANTTLRNMQYPNNQYLPYNSGQPSYYLQSPYWKNPNDLTFDYGGVHYNSGVMNKWFHLLSSGGSQIISGQSRSVGGIGIDKAARIAYYTMINSTNYSSANLTFDVIRATSINAAKILYGICSNEYNQTCAAWRAVNVGVACVPCNMSNWYNNNNQSFTSSIQEREATVLNLAVFPNPANDKITLLLEEINKDLYANSYHITILDINGKVLINQNQKNINNLDIEISSLKSGVYFVNVSTDSWVKTTKFVKQ